MTSEKTPNEVGSLGFIQSKDIIYFCSSKLIATLQDITLPFSFSIPLVLKSSMDSTIESLCCSDKFQKLVRKKREDHLEGIESYSFWIDNMSSYILLD